MITLTSQRIRQIDNQLNIPRKPLQLRIKKEYNKTPMLEKNYKHIAARSVLRNVEYLRITDVGRRLLTIL